MTGMLLLLLPWHRAEKQNAEYRKQLLEAGREHERLQAEIKALRAKERQSASAERENAR